MGKYLDMVTQATPHQREEAAPGPALWAPTPVTEISTTSQSEPGRPADPRDPLPVEHVSNLPLPPSGYCEQCGGGYWVRQAQRTPFHCGRCVPSESRVETVLIPGGTAPLKPGEPSQQPGRVVIEPAMRPDGSPLSPVYWESQGRIVGPGHPEYFFRDSAGQEGLVVRHEGALVHIAASILRPSKAFVAQRPLTEVELIREGPPSNQERGSQG